MIQFGDQQQDAFRNARVAKGPLHRIACRNGLKSGAQSVQSRRVFRSRGVKTDAHEEATRVAIAELLCFDNVATRAKEITGNVGHDSGHIEATQFEDKFIRGHVLVQPMKLREIFR